MTTFTFSLIVLACLAGIVLILLVKVLRIVNGKDRYTLQEKKTVDTYGYLPKAGNANRLLLFLALVLLIAFSSCSPTASLPNGCKYKVYAPKFNK
jgi:hypothetical protein